MGILPPASGRLLLRAEMWTGPLPGTVAIDELLALNMLDARLRAVTCTRDTSAAFKLDVTPADGIIAAALRTLGTSRWQLFDYASITVQTLEDLASQDLPHKCRCTSVLPVWP
jgi:hypothetical protein